jgi:hypothetical protein
VTIFGVGQRIEIIKLKIVRIVSPVSVADTCPSNIASGPRGVRGSISLDTGLAFVAVSLPVSALPRCIRSVRRSALLAAAERTTAIPRSTQQAGIHYK